MKVFGDYSTFAICYELDSNYGGAWLFGKFCYWIGGLQVGDYELGTSLRDVLMFLERVFKDNGCRENQELFELSALEFHNRLFNTLYTGYTGKDTGYEDMAMQECWACLEIDIPVDIFDGWKIFMVEHNQKSRVVYKRVSDDESLSQLYLSSRFVEKVISDAYTDLSKVYQEEINK